MSQRSDKIDYTAYKYLFLDRDGVINVERPDDYVKNIAEFVFVEGAAEAIAELSKHFERIVIITNQRGIGRGIFSEQNLTDVHQYMIGEIESKGGRIDHIYYCTDISNNAINRKPNTGMAFQAQGDYPDIDFEKSIFVGNSKSDILFGNKLDMLTVLVGDKYKPEHSIYKIINVYSKNLATFVEEIKNSDNIKQI